MYIIVATHYHELLILMYMLGKYCTLVLIE